MTQSIARIIGCSVSKSVLWKPFASIMLCGRVFDPQRLRSYGYWRFRNDLCTTELAARTNAYIVQFIWRNKCPEVASSDLDTQCGTCSCRTCNSTKSRWDICEVLHPRIRREFIFHLFRCTFSRKISQGSWNMEFTKHWEDLLSGSAETLADDDLYSAKCLQGLVGGTWRKKTTWKTET